MILLHSRIRRQQTTRSISTIISLTRPTPHHRTPSTSRHLEAKLSKMDNLPVELLLDLLQYLPTSSLIALKLSTKKLYLGTPSPPSGWQRTASPCEKRAAWRYTCERKDAEYDRKRCVLCGAYAYEDGLLGETPICKTHQGRFMKTTFPPYLETSLKIRLERLSKDRLDTIWVSFNRRLCVHRKLVEHWDDTTRTCDCQCDSCGHWPVQCYVRIAGLFPHFDDDSKPVNFEMSEDGRHMIEEHRSPIWQTTTPDKYRILVPVVELAE